MYLALGLSLDLTPPGASGLIKLPTPGLAKLRAEALTISLIPYLAKLRAEAL